MLKKTYWPQLNLQVHSRHLYNIKVIFDILILCTFIANDKIQNAGIAIQSVAQGHGYDVTVLSHVRWKNTIKYIDNTSGERIDPWTEGRVRNCVGFFGTRVRPDRFGSDFHLTLKECWDADDRITQTMDPELGTSAL